MLFSCTDNFYHYDVDGLEAPSYPSYPSYQPSLKLIKRQIDEKDKDKKLLSKTQSEADAENSSNSKPINPASSQAVTENGNFS